MPSVLFQVVENTYYLRTVTAEVASSSLVVPAIFQETYFFKMALLTTIRVGHRISLSNDVIISNNATRHDCAS